MGTRETIAEYRLKVEASASQGAVDLESLAKGEKNAIAEYAGIAQDFARKYAEDRRLTLEIEPGDPIDLKFLKRDLNKLEAARLSAVQKTSETISSVTSASASVASAIYPPAGAAVMIVGSIVNMAYNFFNSAPSHNWAKDATGMWSQYQQVGLPRPSYADGFDNPQGYVQDKLQRGVGFGGINGFGETPDAYQARFESSSPDMQCMAWADAVGGGYLHTAPPDVFRALFMHNIALLLTAPPENINVQKPLYQASPYLAYQYSELGKLRVEGASGGTGIPTWFWWQDCNLCLCSEGPVPLYVRDADDMYNFLKSKNPGPSLPREKSGVSYKQLTSGQVMIDTFIIQMALTAAICQGLPTWASSEVIRAAKDAWASYRKEVLEAYATVYGSGGNIATDPRIGKVTGVTPEGNLVGKIRRGTSGGGAKLVNRGANGLDAMGYVFKAAVNKATELSEQGLSVANVSLFRPAWVNYAKKANFQFATAAERLGDRLTLSPEAKKRLDAKKGVSQALVIPSDQTGFRLSDVPQYVRNTFMSADGKGLFGLSKTGTIVLGVGGLALVGGGGYYLYKSRRRS